MKLLATLLLSFAAQEDTLIKNVTVIDVVTGTRQSERAVLVSDGRIESIRHTDEIAPDAAERVIDGTGGFLIPGLWDMHAQVLPENERHFPLLIANGVTGIRNMLSTSKETLDDVLVIRAKVESGKLLGPRIVANGTILGKTEPGRPNLSSPTDQAGARDAVRLMDSGGADFIEIRGTLPRSVYFAIMEEAQTRGLSTAGLVPWQVTPAEASNAGQKSVEGMFKLLIGCCGQQNKVTARFVDYYKARESSDRKGIRLWPFFLEGLDSMFDEARRAELIATFARNGTWQCPLLRVNHFEAQPDELEFQDSELGAYVPADQRGRWAKRRNTVRRFVSAANPQDNQRYFQRKVDMLREMQRSGVGILAGSGLGRPFMVAGFSLHEELAMLVEAGLTPAEALRAATLAPARFLEREAELGTVEEGKLADLVLLDADPLASIENTTAIRAVLVGGKVLEREALDGLLGEARRLAAR